MKPSNVIEDRIVNREINRHILEDLKIQFENYEKEFGEDITEQTKFLLFALTNCYCSSDSVSLLNELVECYHFVPEYKFFVDECLEYLHKKFCCYCIRLKNGKVVDGSKHFLYLQKLIRKNKFDCSKIKNFKIN